MKTVVIIPARYGSTRLPAKMLRKVGGKTVIEHTFSQAAQSRADAVVIATDHAEIAEVMQKAGAKVVLTDSSLPSGTDRCAQALAQLEAAGESYDYVVNVQGDELFIPPAQINLIINYLHPEMQVLTLVQAIKEAAHLHNPNVVKAVLASPKAHNLRQALYFSRAAIPYFRDQAEVSQQLNLHTYYKHVGMYAFKSEILSELVKLPVSGLERVEMLEQLRWLENGYKIATIETQFSHLSIDTLADLEAAQAQYKV